MSEVEIAKNALKGGLCKDCIYFDNYMCTRVADKFLEKHLENDVFDRENDVEYEDLLEYSTPHNSCKFWKKFQTI